GWRTQVAGEGRSGAGVARLLPRLRQRRVLVHVVGVDQNEPCVVGVVARAQVRGPVEEANQGPCLATARAAAAGRVALDAGLRPDDSEAIAELLLDAAQDVLDDVGVVTADV